MALIKCVECGSISIHGPRVGADMWSGGISPGTNTFQSTAPVWGPTAEGEKEKTVQ